MTLEQVRRLKRKLKALAEGPHSLLTAPSPQPGLYKWPVGEPPGFAIPKVPDEDPGENIVAGEGVYASVQLSPQTKSELNLWARQCGIPEKYLEDRAEYHITTVYSKEPFSGYRPLQLHKPKTVGKGKRKVERFGEAVVVTFSSPTLHKQWEQARAKGASWDFPSYRPHITIAKEVPPKFKVEKIPPYTGVIEIVSEKVEPLDESKGDDGDKEEKEESMLLKAAQRLKTLAAAIEAADDAIIDIDDETELSEIKDGARVRHEKHGEGTVYRPKGQPTKVYFKRDKGKAFPSPRKVSDRDLKVVESAIEESLELKAEAANREQIHQGIRKLRGELNKVKRKEGNPKLLKQMADNIRAGKGSRVEDMDKSCKETAARGPNGMRIRPTKSKKSPPKTKAADARKVAGLGSETKKKKLAEAINAAHKEGRVSKPDTDKAKTAAWRKKAASDKKITSRPKAKKKITRKPKINVAKRFADKASRAANEEALARNPGQGKPVNHPKHGRGFVQEHMAGGKSKVSFSKDMKGLAVRGHRVVDTKDLKYTDQ